MNKVEQAIMASDLEYQKRIAHNNARLLIRKDLQIKAVRELHEEINSSDCLDPNCCPSQDTRTFCSDCNVVYPCDTIKALDVDTDTLERDDDHDSRRDDYREEDLG